MAKRRGNNEGSIYRRKDGYWVGQYGVQTSTGRKTRYIYGKRREEVWEKLTKAIADRDGGFIFDHENMSVGEYLKRWLNDDSESRDVPATVRGLALAWIVHGNELARETPSLSQQTYARIDRTTFPG